MGRRLVLLGALLAAAPAIAEDYYIGASFGGYQFEASGVEIEDSTVGLYVGWEVLPNIAIEGQWIHWSEGEYGIYDAFADISYTFTLNSVDAVAVYARPSFQLADGIEIYGKLGISQSSVKSELLEIGPVGCGFAYCTYEEYDSFEDTATDTVFALGGEVSLPNSIGLRAEVVSFEVLNESSTTYLVSAHYRFK